MRTYRVDKSSPPRLAAMVLQKSSPSLGLPITTSDPHNATAGVLDGCQLTGTQQPLPPDLGRAWIAPIPKWNPLPSRNKCVPQSGGNAKNNFISKHKTTLANLKATRGETPTANLSIPWHAHTNECDWTWRLGLRSTGHIDGSRKTPAVQPSQLGSEAPFPDFSAAPKHPHSMRVGERSRRANHRARFI